MAERRMFAKTIIDSDAFLEMPATSQLLYFHLCMRADDEGFINKPKSIMRLIGCKDDDIRILYARKFIIPFDSGVVVIKHWKIHNYIRGDRLHETKYVEEKALLDITDNQSYTLCQSDVSQLTGSCPTEVRLGKDRIGKVSLDKVNKDDVPEIIYYPNDVLLNNSLKDFIEFRKKMKKPMTDRAIELLVTKLDKMTSSNDEKIGILNQSIMNGWQGIFPLKDDNQSNKFIGKETPEQYARRMEEWANEREGVCNGFFGD